MAFKKILFWDKSTELWRKKFPKKRNCGVAQANVTGGCVEVAPVLEIKFTNKVGSEALLPSLILGRVGFGLVGEGIQPPCIRWGWMLECSPRWESEKCNSQKKLRSKVYIVWQSGLLAICSIVLWMACVGMSSTSLEFSVSFSVTGFCEF